MENEAKQLSCVIQAEINARGMHCDLQSKLPCDLSLQTSCNLFSKTL